MNKIIIYIFLIFIIVCSLLLVYYATNNSTSAIFLSDKETSAFLLTDKDNYVKNMTAADLFARKSSSHSEYIQKIKGTTLSFSEDDKNKLVKCTQIADMYLYKRSQKSKTDIYDIFDIYKQIADISPWKFALTSTQYEEGLPHTREDVIFISTNLINKLDDEKQIVNTIIHEKVHIFQRLNKTLMDKQIIPAMGYIVSPLSDNLIKLRRSNPDINNSVYYDPITERPIIFTYRSEKPTSINDVNAAGSVEHPYEKMAYHIANECTKHIFTDV
jgi:hypothetical protein